MADSDHLDRLRRGVPAWNAWRADHPDARVDLGRAVLTGITNPPGRVLHKGDVTDLRGIDLAGAELDRAVLDFTDLRGADLRGTVLSRTNLRHARLDGARLQGADLYEADLYGAHLSGADLTGARLTRARLVGTDLCGARLVDANVYGVAAWDVAVDAATDQRDLVISDPGRTWETPIVTDRLELAQFLHLLLDNERVRDVLETVTARVVLLLGRFTDERLAVLQALREGFRRRGFVPVLFDFPPTPARDLTETVQIMAGLSRFVVADLTDARSLPQELSHIVPHLPSVPVQPVQWRGGAAYGMFEHWERYPWVRPVVTYADADDLLARLDADVLAPLADARAQADELARLRAEVARLRADAARRP